MKKSLSLLLCAVMLLSLLSGCGTESDEPYVPTGNALADENAPITEDPAGEAEQELTLVYYPGKTMHPLDCADYTNRTILSLVYQSLFVVDDDYEVHPLLCKEYAVSDDMTTYTFFLHDNIRFSDGTPMTVKHVLASLGAAAESAVYGARFQHIYDWWENDDGSFSIYLGTPMENLPILLDFPILKTVPKSDDDEDNEDDEDEDEDATQPTTETQPEEDEGGLPVGSGPYFFDTTRAGLRLLKTVNWWCADKVTPAVTASSVTLTEAGTPAQVRDAFEFGDVGLVCADPGSDTYADFRCDYELWDIDSGIFLYIGFNLDEEFNSIFRDDDLRAAFAHAIDRELLCRQYYRDYAAAASIPVSPHSPYYDETLAAQYAYDKDKFTQAVIKAGAQGEEISILVNPNDSLRMRVAEEIADMLEECGLVVKLEEAVVNFEDNISYRSTHLYLAQTKLSNNMDLSPFFYTYGTLSYGALDNEGIYAFCKEALVNQGNYYNLHQQVMEQGLICPVLFRSYAVYATRGLLTGLTPARDNVFYYDFGTDLGDIQIYLDEEPTEEE